MSDRSSITLRARYPGALEDDGVRRTVESTAHAIGERTGVAIERVAMDADSVTVALGTHKLGAVGFAAELRRLTERWYAHKHEGESLWGSTDDEQGEW